MQYDFMYILYIFPLLWPTGSFIGRVLISMRDCHAIPSWAISHSPNSGIKSRTCNAGPLL